ncbi:MAG: DNA polymerase Y family protein [Kordiimonas sp.]
MRRITSLWLPHWPIERWMRANRQKSLPGEAFALTETQDQTQKLYATCLRAQTLGITRGMSLAEARAIKPDIETTAANAKADYAALDALARWFIRYTPLSAINNLDGIFLDITGCSHLFGGELAMLKDMTKRLKLAGITLQTSIAETPGAAWAFTRFKPGHITPEHENSLQALALLPIKALRLDDASTTTLSRLGLKKVGDIMDIPRHTLARRFRDIPAKQVTALLIRLDQALGKQEEPIKPLQPLPSWQVRQAFMEPMVHIETLETAVVQLMQRLCVALCAAEQGAMRIQLSAFRVDGTVQQLMVGTNKPSRDAAHIMRLFHEKLPQLDAGFGFDLLVLAAHETSELRPEQTGDQQAENTHSIAKLIDKISARLGPTSVHYLKHKSSHLPERSQTLSPPSTSDLCWANFPKNKPLRPIRLLQRPENIEVLAEVPEGAPRSFRWRRVQHTVTKAEGPERISNEWWHKTGGLTRDYYRIEVTGGARFWVFRHGLYGIPRVRSAESKQPLWYMHGFFP